MLTDALGRWEKPGERRACCCSSSDPAAGTQTFQAGGFALHCCGTHVFGYKTRLCLSMGKAAVHLFFPFPRLPSREVLSRLLNPIGGSGPSALWRKETAGVVWCEGGEVLMATGGSTKLQCGAAGAWSRHQTLLPVLVRTLVGHSQEERARTW